MELEYEEFIPPPNDYEEYNQHSIQVDTFSTNSKKEKKKKVVVVVVTNNGDDNNNNNTTTTTTKKSLKRKSTIAVKEILQSIVSKEHEAIEKLLQQQQQLTKELLDTITEERLKNAKMREDLPVYVKFPFLDGAVMHNMNHFNHVMPTFAHNHPSSKTNYFVLASYTTVWNSIVGGRLKNANFYEQLRPLDPCHGHIDVEIYRNENQTRSNDEIESDIHIRMMDEMAQLMIDMKYIKTKDEFDYIVSEASNEKKVSFHFHIIIKHKRWKNNYHFGAFMRCLCIHLQKKYGKDPAQNPFFFQSPPKKSKNQQKYEFWADMAIYTCNRNFRMMYNSKSDGDYRPLMPTDIRIKNRDYKKRPRNTMEFDKKLWFRSLLQRMTIEEIQEGSKFQWLLCRDPITKEEPVSTSNTLYFRLDLTESNTSIPKSLSNNNNNNNNKTEDEQYSSSSLLPPRKKSTHFFIDQEKYKSHPLFSKIGQEILQYWINRYDPQTQKVTCSGYNTTRMIAYYTSYSKYCLLNGGKHENNHVKFFVNLVNGRCYQSCWDSDNPNCVNQFSEGFDIFNKRDELWREITLFVEAQKSGMKPKKSIATGAKKMLQYMNNEDFPLKFFQSSHII